MMAFFDANDKVLQARFLELMTEGLDRVRGPDRYKQLRDACTELEKFRDTVEFASEEHFAINAAIANVEFALNEYEDADPVRIVNDLITLAPTRDCKLCGEQTTGSIGAAGYRWTMICQQCKDKEDTAAQAQIESLGRAIRAVGK